MKVKPPIYTILTHSHLIFLFQIILFFLVALVVGDPLTDTPKSRGPNSAPTSHLNSITNSKDSTKPQPTPNVSVQSNNNANTPQPQRQVLQPSPQVNNQPQSAIFTHVQSGNNFQPSAGYFLTVNPNQQLQNVAGGQTPILMQYIPQSQGQGVQYIQLIARPIVLPYQQFVPQLQPQSALSSVPQQQTNILTQPQQLQQSPQIYGQPQQFNNYPNYGALPTPVSPPNLAGYQNQHNLNSPFYNGPQSRVFNSTPDLSLNTNEYMPPQAEGGFRAIKPQGRP